MCSSSKPFGEFIFVLGVTDVSLSTFSLVCWSFNVYRFWWETNSFLLLFHMHRIYRTWLNIFFIWHISSSLSLSVDMLKLLIIFWIFSLFCDCCFCFFIYTCLYTFLSFILKLYFLFEDLWFHLISFFCFWNLFSIFSIWNNSTMHRYLMS